MATYLMRGRLADESGWVTWEADEEPDLTGASYVDGADAITDSTITVLRVLQSGGGSGLPSASGANEFPASTGAGTTYTARTPAQTRAVLGLPTAFNTPLAQLRVNAAGNGYEEFMAYATGHSYDRPAAATAGGGARWRSKEDRQVFESTGDATLGWDVVLPSGLGPDKAGLTHNGSLIYASGIDCSGFVVGSTTMAVLFEYITRPTSGQYAGLIAIGTTAGSYDLLIQNIGGNDTICVYNRTASTPQTNLKAFVGAMPAGIHRFVLKLINSSGQKWRWSYDGKDALGVAGFTDTAVASTVVTPPASSLVALGSTTTPDVPLGGRSIAGKVWRSAVSDAQIVALATAPATEDYLLAENAITGPADISLEARFYNPSFPAVLNGRGLNAPAAVGGNARQYVY